MSVDAVFGRCALVWVEGPDSVSFLQGLLTNDVAAMATGDARAGLVLDNTGHIRVDLRVVRTAETEYTLVTDESAGGRLAELLDGYHFSEDVEIIGPELFAHVTFLSEPGADLAPPADLVIEGRVPGTVEAIGVDAEAIASAAGARRAESALLEAARIAAGVPRHGVDMGERTLVHEAGLEHVAVSFDKGCYLGQETVARVEYRGGVNRRLVGLRLPAPVDPGSTVTVDGRVVGAVSSVAVHPHLGAIALATLRKEVVPGALVRVDDLGAPAVVSELPFTIPSQFQR